MTTTYNLEQSTKVNQEEQLTQLAAILAQMQAIATGAKQDSGNATLASMLAAIATAAKQDSGNTTLTSILSAIATASKQDTQTTALNALNTTLTAILSRMSSSAASVTSTNILLVSAVVLPANPNRKGFILFNNSSNSAYATFGATSSSAACTRLIATFTSWEVLQGCIYTGTISAIRNAGSGAIVAFELT